MSDKKNKLILFFIKLKYNIKKEMSEMTMTMTKQNIKIDDYSLDVFTEEDWGKGQGECVMEEVMDFFRLPDETFVIDDKKVLEIFNIEDFKNYINNNDFKNKMVFYSPDGLDDDDDFQLIICIYH